jgi:hypothetical protein
MPEHKIHHRGQLYTMLGMLNVPTPPLYGMTATQVQQIGSLKSEVERPQGRSPLPKYYRSM